MKNLNFLIYLKKKKTFFKNYSILNNNNNNNNNSLKDKELLKFSKNIYENTILKNLKEKTWLQLLQTEFQKEYFQNILNFLEEEKKKKKNIYPPENEIFNAFNFTPFDKVKVIIIGQDPYHGEGQAHGLSFSVKKGITPPPSLRNIFKELKNDLGNDFKTPSIKNGNLENWAKQGVLLLNATLTVEANHPNSHANCGWQLFTDYVIKLLNDKRNNLVFILWGAFAQKKGKTLDTKKHYILTSAHPSPYSASSFFGCKVFSKTNEYLQKIGKEPINWNIE